jgi:CheY-like chemotaxis protein
MSAAPVAPRVLLVEHNRETAEIYASALAADGFAPVRARTAEDGLAIARRIHPDAVVTAIAFPGAMDGLELTRRLRCDPATLNARVIVLTGRAFDTDRQAARRAGCDVFLTKPCAPVTLLEHLRQLLASTARSPRRAASESPPTLCWSRRGDVACAEHSPACDSPRWQEEGWVPMPARVLNGRVRYQCQVCMGSPIAHDARKQYEERIARLQRASKAAMEPRPPQVEEQVGA